jgi:hypothetical protein
MNKIRKKVWVKPLVLNLSIKNLTLSGGPGLGEQNSGNAKASGLGS